MSFLFSFRGNVDLNSKKIALAALIILSATLIYAPLIAPLTHATTDWNLTVTASSSGYSSTTTFGINSTAISGFDESNDLVVPPAPPQGVYSYLYESGNPSSPVNLQDLSQDIQPDSGSSWLWTLYVENVGQSGSLTLSWSTSVPASTLTLTPSGGSQINMLTQDTYAFTVNSGTLYVFTVAASESSSSPSPTASSGSVSGGGSGGSGGSNNSPSPTPAASASPAPQGATHPWWMFWYGWGVGNWKLPSFSIGGSGIVDVSVKIVVFVMAVAAVLLAVAVILRRRK